MSKVDEANIYIHENKHKINKQYRLNYHLMGEYGWINDPNGFIYYKGKYHVFYQHYPYAPVWGPMHWGHAVSQDLVKWAYMPVALAPDRVFDKDGCFSGSSIEIDDKLYLMYTGHIVTEENKEHVKQVQCLAYSEDGITFNKLENNPVIDTKQIPEKASKKDFRDPKIFKEGESYYVVLGSHDNCGNGQALLYKSKDLINWDFVNIIAKSSGDIGKIWECPDIFKLQDRDIFVVSPQYMKPQGNNFSNLHSSVYIIGDFDVEKGIFDIENYYSMDFGFDFYAPQTTIDSKNRRIAIAWMDMWETPMPTEKQGHNWAGAMILPREMILKNDRIYFKPIEEIENYRRNLFSLDDMKLKGEKFIETYGDSYELQVTFDAKEAEEFGVKLAVGETCETVISYNRANKILTFNRDNSGIGPKGQRKTEANLIDNKLSLRIFVDKCSVEVFINHGEKVMTGRIYPDRDGVKIKAFSKGESEIVSLKKWDLEV